MEIKTAAVKYSLFGNFEAIGATPVIITKLLDSFGQGGFVPSTIRFLKVQQPQNTVEQVLRPQLINQEKNCTISMLPDRVDIEVTNGNNTEYVIDYLNTLVQLFELKINRVSLFTTSLMTELTKEDIISLGTKLAPPENYAEEQNLIEFYTRRVIRRGIEDLGEEINVGRNIQGIAAINDGKFGIEQVKLDTDINTRGELNTERFTPELYKVFFDEAIRINEEILSYLMGMIKDDR